jgi:4-aminobutyrate aminotransferase-like enzyme
MSYKANFRINPPLILKKEEADTGLQILDDAFSFVRDHVAHKE